MFLTEIRYEAYYDLILGGQYTFKIGELHKQYGPIIRISPWELHISDPVCQPLVICSPTSHIISSNRTSENTIVNLRGIGLL